MYTNSSISFIISYCTPYPCSNQTFWPYLQSKIRILSLTPKLVPLNELTSAVIITIFCDENVYKPYSTTKYISATTIILYMKFRLECPHLEIRVSGLRYGRKQQQNQTHFYN